MSDNNMFIRNMVIMNSISKIEDGLQETSKLQLNTIANMRKAERLYHEVSYALSLLIAQYEDMGFCPDDKLY